MSRAQRAGWVAALATALTATTMSTVVQGLTWYLEVLLVVLAVAATGTVVTRWLRHPALVVGSQLVVLVLLVTWLYALPEAVLAVLPGPAALSRLWFLVGEGMRVAQDEAAPAPATEGLRLLLALGIGAVAVAVDLLASALRQPAAAGLPLLAVYCVPAALARDGLDWYWFVLAATGFLLLLASDSGDRIARWGRVLSGQGGEHAPMAATGRRVGAMALGAAVLLPTLVPGLSEGLLPGAGRGGVGGPGGRIQVTNPIFSLRDNLGARADLTVMTYVTDHPSPEPLRIVTVDTYDGNTWGPRQGAIPREQSATGPLPTAPGLAPSTPVAERTTEITIQQMVGSAYLPLPYPPVEVDVEGDWLYEAETLNVLGDGVSTGEGLRYTVRHLEVSPDAADLAYSPSPPAEVVERWTELPPNLPENILTTAQQVAGEGSDFEKATRLQSYFRSSGGFSYNETAPNGNSTSAISDFLERRSGFCVHFASTMAVMARALGIPARVAVGFLPGAQMEDGSYRVSLRDSHAWPELYFSGVGWMRFEPTPATRTGALPRWAAPLPQPGATTTGPEATDAGAAPSNPRLNEEEQADDDAGGFDLAGMLRSVPWRVVFAIAVVIAVLAAPMTTAALVRRRRWRRARTPGEYAEAAWTTLSERLVDLGVGWPGSRTPRQTEQRISEGLSDRGTEALHRLARAVEQARYARTPGDVEGRTLRHDVATVVHAVAQNRPGSYSWRARLLPRSGAEHLRRWLVDSGLALDAWERRIAGRLGQWRRRLGERLRGAQLTRV